MSRCGEEEAVMQLSRTSTSFYRRLYIAYLIDCGVNTVPKLIAEIDIPRRTAQDTLLALEDIGIKCVFIGERKNGCYSIESWGVIDKDKLALEVETIKLALGY